MSVTATLSKGYGREDHEATGFQIVVQAPNLRVTADLPMHEALALMRQLTEGLQAYRTSATKAFGLAINNALSEAETAFNS